MNRKISNIINSLVKAKAIILRNFQLLSQDMAFELKRHIDSDWAKDSNNC